MNDAETLRETIQRYNDAWNRHDVDAIVSMHAPDFVFHNWTANERVEASDAHDHIARIFRNTPNLRFTSRRLYARDGLVVSEWTAHVERDGEQLEWDGVDVFPFEDGLIKRKDVYSSSHAPRTRDAGAIPAETESGVSVLHLRKGGKQMTGASHKTMHGAVTTARCQDKL